MSFEVRSFGKWILSGEHAVIRGSPALVFPLFEFYIDVRGESDSSPLKIEFKGPYSQGLDILFSGLLERALEKVGRERSELTGRWVVDSHIPLGTGLGASAAMCVAVTKIFAGRGWLKSEEIYDFARNLENMFHGESSGVDIAASMASSGIRFTKNKERLPIVPKWQPNLYLSYSGQRGLTSECVNKVKTRGERDPAWLKRWDDKMTEATELAQIAILENPSTGLTKLAGAMEQARHCFIEWGLVEGPLQAHIEKLRWAGAMAVKPTGSGGGGYVLSLWENEPSPSLIEELIPIQIPN